MIGTVKKLTIVPDILWNLVVMRYRHVQIEEWPLIFGRIVVRGHGKLRLGSGIEINSNSTKNPVGLGNRCMFYAAENAEIIIGNRVGISTSLLYAQTSIVIEDNVLIGGGCQILDTDFHSVRFEDRINNNGDSTVNTQPIQIKSGAFVGASSIILKGVVIGFRSVVAAGSVVTKSIPNGEVWGGNPAKFIKKIE